jgi:transcriptional regulator with GAF, ATPase, and Fis domain
MSDDELPTTQDPADALAAVAALRRLADQVEDAAVEQAMRAGWSWPQVAEALGVTRQAVHKKHAKRLIAAGVELRRRDNDRV